MLLSNYYGISMVSEFAAVNGNTRTIDPTTYALSNKIKNTSGTALTEIPCKESLWGNYRFGSMTASGIIIGRGNSPVQLSDYKLQLPIETSKYSRNIVTHRIVYDGSNGQFYTETVMIVTCTAPEGLTVSEWGMVSNTGNFLFYREVFETPFELALGDTLTFTIRGTMNTPLAD